MSKPTGAIFLSYALQDADAARELFDDEFIEMIRSVLDD